MSFSPYGVGVLSYLEILPWSLTPGTSSFTSTSVFVVPKRETETYLHPRLSLSVLNNPVVMYLTLPPDVSFSLVHGVHRSGFIKPSLKSVSFFYNK